MSNKLKKINEYTKDLVDGQIWQQIDCGLLDKVANQVREHVWDEIWPVGQISGIKSGFKSLVNEWTS